VTVVLALAGFLGAYLFATFVIYPPAEALGEAIEVPDLVGMTADEAREVLRNAGLSVEEEVPIPDADERRGRIVAQNPLAGQALRPGAGVRLAISAGPPRLRVPNLLGFEEETAVAVLERAGFRVERSREIAEELEGRVARIQPAPGSEQEIPATVVLVISTGPPDEVTEDTTPPTPDTGGGAPDGEEPPL
jgi:serine/threonine-protein kinase